MTSTSFLCFIDRISSKELFWVAPELLPITIIPGTPATQKGDVYSFAIILEEIVVRGGPYETARQFLDVHGNAYVNKIRKSKSYTNSSSIQLPFEQQF